MSVQYIVPTDVVDAEIFHQIRENADLLVMQDKKSEDHKNCYESYSGNHMYPNQIS